MARNLLKAWPALWTFAKHPSVEPTNNHAERALHSAVIYRKPSFDSQPKGGELRTTRLLSAHTTSPDEGLPGPGAAASHAPGRPSAATRSGLFAWVA
jgi:hypothetical protein